MTVVVVGCSAEDVKYSPGAQASSLDNGANASPAASDGSPKFAFYTVDHYDGARNTADDLAATVERAQAENKRILLQVGGDWCGWCKRMSEFIETNNAVRDTVSHNYLLMKVTHDDTQKNEEFLSQYPKISAYPHLFVLDSDGKLLHSQGTGELEEGQGYNEKVYLEFLEKWKPRA
ncbi:MAG: thioredoxin family protein [Pirellulales bacterium]